jgi:hypothetical protein
LEFCWSSRISTENEQKQCEAQKRCKLTEEKEREKFEREYVAKHMSADALNSVESLRSGETYDDEHLAESFKKWREGLEW